MSDLSGITVAELVSLLRERHKRVPFEVGAFITLQAVESALERPALVNPDDVSVADDGMVSVAEASGESTGAELTRSASGLLAHLLLGAGSAVPGSLLSLVERGPSDGSQQLARFRDELEASLLPLNRAASRRILARLVREGRGDAASAAPMYVVDEASLDADLDALLGIEATPGSGQAPLPAPALHTDAGEGMLDGPSGVEPARMVSPPAVDGAARLPARAERPASRIAHTPMRPQAQARATDEGDNTRDEPPRGLSDLETADHVASRGSRAGFGWAALLFALVIGTAAVIGVVRPDVLRRMMGEAPPPAPDHAAEQARVRAEAERQAVAVAAERFGDLVVKVPDRSQVLMRVGRGPAVASNLPVGVAHEFVAIAEGREPTRAVVHAEAEWESGGDQGPRYELAMQTGEAQVRFEDLELGPTRLPREVGQHRGQLGAIRVLTNPPGAEVFLLIGFGPEIHVRDLRTDQTYELLVYKEGHRPRRVTVAPDGWEPGEAGRRVEVEVTLEPRPARTRRR